MSIFDKDDIVASNKPEKDVPPIIQLYESIKAENGGVFPIPVDADDVIRALDLDKSYHDDVRIIFGFVESQKCMITKWKDMEETCFYLLETNTDNKWAKAIDKKKTNDLLLKVRRAELLNVPLIPRDSIDIERSYINSDINGIRTGEEFEQYCASLLEKNGYIRINTTPGSGDHGVDILAEKDTITYAIQCKYYSSPVGNSAVQEVYTGKGFYHRDIAIVMTNNTFTKQAKEEAEALGVKLWDGEVLERFEH